LVAGRRKGSGLDEREKSEAKQADHNGRKTTGTKRSSSTGLASVRAQRHPFRLGISGTSHWKYRSGHFQKGITVNSPGFDSRGS
jgi:hypothetical protein